MERVPRGRCLALRTSGSSGAMAVGRSAVANGPTRAGCGRSARLIASRSVHGSAGNTPMKSPIAGSSKGMPLSHLFPPG